MSGTQDMGIGCGGRQSGDPCDSAYSGICPHHRGEEKEPDQAREPNRRGYPERNSPHGGNRDGSQRDSLYPHWYLD